MNAAARYFSLLLLLALGAPVAQGSPARPSARVLTAAKAHFKQGRAFQEAGVYADAIREYEKAYALTPLGALLYNIAQCHRLGGDKHKAIAAYARYLAAAPDGPLADEARSHVASLKMKIQVEEAEAAKRRAEADADAARRRTKELEDARGHAATEALRRLKEEQARQAEEGLRRQREAAQARRQRVAAEAQYRRKMAATQGQGLALRATGITAQVVGSVIMALAAVPIATLWMRDMGRLKTWDNGNDGPRWATRLDRAVEGQRLGRDLAIVCFTSGGALLVTGIVLEVLGKRQRRRAEQAIERPVTLLPLVSPEGTGVLVQGRF